MSLLREAVSAIRQTLAGWPAEPGQGDLFQLLALMGRWRAHMLANTYIRHHGRIIWSGPFAGMDYVDKATEGALIPRLLGSYECELHPHLEAFAAEGVDCVIDVGCAEGYYAVGLARLMPNATIHARDIQAEARAACGELAARNGVADRVVVGGIFNPTDFEAFAGQRVLVMVDAEGAEVDILRPDLSPALAGMNIIVETHDVNRPGALAAMMERFSATHDIVRVETGPKTTLLPPWLADLSQLDQLLAVWEWRRRPTPWLVMRPKAA